MYITNMFKHRNLKVAYRSNNSTEINLSLSTQNSKKYLASEVYKQICPECGKAYTNQTERSFLNDKKNFIYLSRITTLLKICTLRKFPHILANG
jgi:hypothetical protein